jgi:hypothetical protein
MSALPPKADMCGALADVCFGPIADIKGSDRGFPVANARKVVGQDVVDHRKATG